MESPPPPIMGEPKGNESRPLPRLLWLPHYWGRGAFLPLNRRQRHGRALTDGAEVDDALLVPVLILARHLTLLADRLAADQAGQVGPAEDPVPRPPVALGIVNQRCVCPHPGLSVIGNGRTARLVGAGDHGGQRLAEAGEFVPAHLRHAPPGVQAALKEDLGPEIVADAGDNRLVQQGRTKGSVLMRGGMEACRKAGGVERPFAGVRQAVRAERAQIIVGLERVPLAQLKHGCGEQDGRSSRDGQPGAFAPVHFQRLRVVEDVPAAPHHQVGVEVVAAFNAPDQVLAPRPDALHPPPVQEAGPFV